jgi:hypothetical protein
MLAIEPRDKRIATSRDVEMPPARKENGEQ